MTNLLWRNMKWRFQNPLSIAITILQPLIWLVLYSTVAGQTMQNMGIENYTAFVLPGIIVLVAFSASSSGGIINFLMKSSGSYYRIIIAPVSRSSIVFGQVLEAVLLSFVEMGILCVIAFFFSVRIASGLVGIILMVLIIFLTAFFMSSLAYTISLILPNEVIYETIMSAIILPIFFLSTALFPLDKMSGGLKMAIMLNPFTHIINALREIILGEAILPYNILPVIILFVVLCCVSFTLAILRLKRETSH